jgi:hypothetical protein
MSSTGRKTTRSSSDRGKGALQKPPAAEPAIVRELTLKEELLKEQVNTAHFPTRILREESDENDFSSEEPRAVEDPKRNP